jgi:hypothetical protein
MMAANMNILYEFWFVKDCYSIFGKFPGRLSEKYPASIHFWKRRTTDVVGTGLLLICKFTDLSILK